MGFVSYEESQTHCLLISSLYAKLANLPLAVATCLPNVTQTESQTLQDFPKMLNYSFKDRGSLRMRWNWLWLPLRARRTLPEQPKGFWKVLHPGKGKSGSQGGSWSPVALSFNFSSRSGSHKLMGAFPDFLHKCFYGHHKSFTGLALLWRHLCVWQGEILVDKPLQHKICLFKTALVCSCVASWRRQEHVWKRSLVRIELRLRWNTFTFLWSQFVLRIWLEETQMHLSSSPRSAEIGDSHPSHLFQMDQRVAAP